MISTVPEELKIEFLIKHPNAKILDYIEEETDRAVFFVRTIYWIEGNLLGIYSITEIKDSGVKLISNNYMKVGDISRLIKLSEFNI